MRNRWIFLAVWVGCLGLPGRSGELRALPADGGHGVPEPPYDCRVQNLLERIETTLSHEKEYAELSSSAKSYLGYLRSARDRATPYMKKGDWSGAYSRLGSADRYIGYIERRVASARSSLREQLDTLVESKESGDLVKLALSRHKLGVQTNTVSELIREARKAAETTKDWQAIALAQLRDLDDAIAGSNSLLEAESHIETALDLETLVQTWSSFKNHKHQQRLLVICIQRLASEPIPEALEPSEEALPMSKVVNKLNDLLRRMQRLPRNDRWHADFRTALRSVIPLTQTSGEVLNLIVTVDRAVLPENMATELQAQLMDRGISMIFEPSEWYTFIRGLPPLLRDRNRHVFKLCLERVTPGTDALKVSSYLAKYFPEGTRELVAASAPTCETSADIHRLIGAMNMLEFEPAELRKQLDRLSKTVEQESDYRYLARGAQVVFKEDRKALVEYLQNVSQKLPESFEHHYNMAVAFMQITGREYRLARENIHKAESLAASNAQWRKLGFFHSCWLNNSGESQRCYSVGRLLDKIESLEAQKKEEETKELEEEAGEEKAGAEVATPHSEKL